MSYELIFDTFCSSDYGIIVSGSDIMNTATRNVESVQVAGRNGALHFDQGNYGNVEVEFECAVKDADLFGSMGAIRAELASRGGKYYRLEESGHPDQYLMARFCGTLEPEPNYILTGATFKLLFDRMPQRFLKSGEYKTTFTANGIITNPTKMPARPLLRVYGSGTLGVGEYSMTIAEHTSDYMDIDCDLMDAFCESTNLNKYLTIDEFPELEHGDNGITLGSGITKVEVVPRWWTL